MKTHYKIEKNIPIPRSLGGGRTSEYFYPLEKMQVGDSFLIHLEKYTNKERAKIASRVAMWQKRNATDKKFATRRVDEGVRVWRTM